jgi:hypothetical protein
MSMANTLFPSGREGFLDGSLDWDTATQKLFLIRGYTYDSTDISIADVTASGATIVASGTLSGKTATGGAADANDLTLTAVPPGAACETVIIAQTSGPAGGADLATTAQRLLVFIDTGSNSSLPVTPNGGDLTFQFDNGANKIFKL